MDAFLHSHRVIIGGATRLDSGKHTSEDESEEEEKINLSYWYTEDDVTIITYSLIQCGPTFRKHRVGSAYCFILDDSESFSIGSDCVVAVTPAIDLLARSTPVDAYIDKEQRKAWYHRYLENEGVADEDKSGGLKRSRAAFRYKYIDQWTFLPDVMWSKASDVLDVFDELLPDPEKLRQMETSGAPLSRPARCRILTPVNVSGTWWELLELAVDMEWSYFPTGSLDRPRFTIRMTLHSNKDAAGGNSTLAGVDSLTFSLTSSLVRRLKNYHVAAEVSIATETRPFRPCAPGDEGASGPMICHALMLRVQGTPLPGSTIGHEHWPLGVPDMRMKHLDVVRRAPKERYGDVSIPAATRSRWIPLANRFCAHYLEEPIESSVSLAGLCEKEKGLFLAVQQGDYAAVASILGGAMEVTAMPATSLINCANIDDVTPLHLVSRYTNCSPVFLALARLLVCKGALVVEAGVRHLSPADKTGKTALHYACENADGTPMARLLCDMGANTNQQDIDLRTPLHVAVKSGGVGLVEFLIAEAGADCTKFDRLRRTPLLLAVSRPGPINLAVVDCFFNKLEDMEWLVVEDEVGGAEAGTAAASRYSATGKRSEDLINAVDTHGNSCLHYAVKKMDEEVTRKLLNQGAYSWLRNDDGRLPLEMLPPDDAGDSDGVVRLRRLLQADGAPTVAEKKNALSMPWGFGWMRASYDSLKPKEAEAQTEANDAEEVAFVPPEGNAMQLLSKIRAHLMNCPEREANVRAYIEEATKADEPDVAARAKHVYERYINMFTVIDTHRFGEWENFGDAELQSDYVYGHRQMKATTNKLAKLQQEMNMYQQRLDLFEGTVRENWEKVGNDYIKTEKEFSVGTASATQLRAAFTEIPRIIRQIYKDSCRRVEYVAKYKEELLTLNKLASHYRMLGGFFDEVNRRIDTLQVYKHLATRIVEEEVARGAKKGEDEMGFSALQRLLSNCCKEVAKELQRKMDALGEKISTPGQDVPPEKHRQHFGYLQMKKKAAERRHSFIRVH